MTKSESTEQKIKEVARNIFQRKGFAATKTRDIADEAGINLALMNYYFRSKEKLFHLIMEEVLLEFMMSLKSVLNNEKTSLSEKIDLFVNRYIDLILRQPDLPIFILSELRNNPDHLIHTMNVRDMLLNSILRKQYNEAQDIEGSKKVHFFHFLMNMMSMTVFPFVASPMLKHIGNLQDDQFRQLIEERRKLIPIWMKQMIGID